MFLSLQWYAPPQLVDANSPKVGNCGGIMMAMIKIRQRWLEKSICGFSFLSPSWWSFSPSSHRSLMVTPQVAWVCWLAGWLVQLIPELPLSPTLPPLVRQVMAPQSEVIPLVTNTLHMALHCRVGASHYISAISNHDSDQVESKRDLNHIISRDPFSHLWTHFGPNWLGPLSLSQLINLDCADRPSSIYW